MFNKSKIETGLYGVVGLRQPYDPDYQLLDADNQLSSSGYFVTDNPYVKVDYLKSNQDYVSISDADFNTEVKQIQHSAIASVANAIFNDSDYIDRQVLYPHAQNRVNVETLPDGLVCHKIRVANEKNVAFEITRVLLDFQGTGDIELMLFNTSQDAPIESKVIKITSTHQTELLNWRVDNSGDTYKGEYYLGYLTNYIDIGTLKPFKRDYDRSDIQSCITHLDINQFYFVNHGTNALPNLDNESSLDEAIGLNCDITVFDDFTDMILNNKMLFGYAIYLDMCIKIISTYAASSRSNAKQRFSESQVIRMIQEIEGQNTDGSVKVTGLRPQLLGELKRLTKEIDKLKQGYFGSYARVETLM
jgi:hypothetical protein